MGWESITGPLESFLDFVVVILKLVVAVFGFLAGARVGTWLLPRNAKGSVRVLSMLICGGAGFLLLWWAVNKVDSRHRGEGAGGGKGAGSGASTEPACWNGWPFRSWRKTS